MAIFQKSLDVYQGYDFKKDVTTSIGFITALQIGDKSFAADQRCADPMAPDQEISVVAVLSGCLWDLGVTDAHYFSGQISTANKQLAAVLLAAESPKSNCEYTFTIYDFDPIENKYFKSLHPTDEVTLEGALEKSGPGVNLEVNDTPAIEVPSPENYAFQIGVKPVRKPQSVTLATSFFDKVRKEWGEPRG